MSAYTSLDIHGWVQWRTPPTYANRMLKCPETVFVSWVASQAKYRQKTMWVYFLKIYLSIKICAGSSMDSLNISASKPNCTDLPCSEKTH